jgi:hypothetical protein
MVDFDIAKWHHQKSLEFDGISSVHIIDILTKFVQLS